MNTIDSRRRSSSLMTVLPPSFVRFVYPFLFDGRQFSQRKRNIDGATYGEPLEKALWEPDTFPVDEMLPHVANYLNPPEDTQATVQMWKIRGDALQSPAGLGSAKNIEWNLQLKDRAIRFRADEYQLSLFRVGVGFLSVRVRLPSEEIGTWLDFIHYFRFLKRSDVAVSARRRVGKGVFAPYFPPLAISPDRADDERTFGDIFRGLLHAAALPSESQPWWQDVFIAKQALPYAGLFLENSPEAEDGTLLYRIHNFFHAAQQIHPAPNELDTDQEHLLAYARRQWWVFSLDGGAFVSSDTPATPFFRETLPDHVDAQYFVLYLVALHQRFALMGLSADVSRHWLLPDGTEPPPDEDAREDAFRRIRDTLLAFTARGHFAQIMQRRHHHRCYQRWLETLQIDRLFDEVSQEVRDMHEYLLIRKTAQVERLVLRLNVLAIIFIPPALVLSMLDALDAWDVGWGTIIGFTLIGLAIGLSLAGCFFPKTMKSYGARWLQRIRAMFARQNG